MDPPSTEGAATQTVEARMDHLPGTACSGSPRLADPARSRTRADAGGGRRVSERCIPLCRGVTSSGSECPGLLHRPQLTEPPDADPHVRWCGRGVAGESRLPPIPIVGGLGVERCLWDPKWDPENSGCLAGTQ